MAHIIWQAIRLIARLRRQSPSAPKSMIFQRRVQLKDFSHDLEYLLDFAKLRTEPEQDGVMKRWTKLDFPFTASSQCSCGLVNNPMIEALRQTFGSTSDVKRTCLGSQKSGDKYLEDAFVDRIR